jgi:presenilin-like A22 family membrane protease
MLFTNGYCSKQHRVSKLSENNQFKVEMIYLLPILASLLFGLGCTWLLFDQQNIVPSVTPVPQDTPGAPAFDALYFVVLIAISASVFYILIKHKSRKVITALIGVAMTAAAILMSLIYLPVLFSRLFPILNSLPEIYFDTLIISLTIMITILLDLAIFRFGTRSGNVAVILLGGALGVFLGKYLPFYSTIAILIFLAVYDVIAVYRGPVGKIAQSSNGLEELHGLSYSFKDIQMGLGDLVFYSMLASGVFFFGGIIPYVVAVVGVLVGSIITFFMLERKDIFPGLPFPIALGLGGGLLTYFLLLAL